MEKTFPIADVTLIGGVLHIDSDRISCNGKHYNVVVKQEGNIITVTGEKPSWGLSLSKGEFDLDEITEDSIEEYRPIFFLKKTKKRSGNMVEFKERSLKTYQSTSWVMTEQKPDHE
jgi:phosphotransferase system IIA component